MQGKTSPTSDMREKKTRERDGEKGSKDKENNKKKKTRRRQNKRTRDNNQDKEVKKTGNLTRKLKRPVV